MVNNNQYCSLVIQLALTMLGKCRTYPFRDALEERKKEKIVSDKETLQMRARKLKFHVL